MSKVLLADPIHQLGQSILTDNGVEIVPYLKGKEELISKVSDVDAIIVRTSKITKEVIDSAPDLKIIARHGSGTDNIDIACASERGIYVTNTPDANTVAVAEHVIAFMLEMSKKISWCDHMVKNGEWSFREQFRPQELQGKVLGLIGYGRIGRDIARKACLGFDMKVVAYDPYIAASGAVDNYAVFVDNIDYILKNADFVSLHVPSTKETIGMINKEKLGLMKPSACLINAARGNIVSEDDLIEALKNKTIAAAAVDVFETEPPISGHGFFGLDNIILTPHNAALTEGAMVRAATGAAEEVVRCLKGKSPRYIVNKKAFE